MLGRVGLGLVGSLRSWCLGRGKMGTQSTHAGQPPGHQERQSRQPFLRIASCFVSAATRASAAATSARSSTRALSAERNSWCETNILVRAGVFAFAISACACLCCVAYLGKRCYLRQRGNFHMHATFSASAFASDSGFPTKFMMP